MSEMKRVNIRKFIGNFRLSRSLSLFSSPYLCVLSLSPLLASSIWCWQIFLAKKRAKKPFYKRHVFDLTSWRRVTKTGRNFFGHCFFSAFHHHTLHALRTSSFLLLSLFGCARILLRLLFVHTHGITLTSLRTQHNATPQYSIALLLARTSNTDTVTLWCQLLRLTTSADTRTKAKCTCGAANKRKAQNGELW